MKNALIFLTLFALSSHMYAQAPTFEWANSAGGSSYDRGHSITIDDLGNSYATGVYAGTVDFDPSVEEFNLVSNGSFDIFIRKLNESGDLLWAKSVGGSLLDMGNSIIVDEIDGSLYISGYYRETVDFDPGDEVFNLVSNGGIDIFILKLDADGDFIWAKSIGGTSTDIGNELTQDNLGDIYLTGSFRSTVDFDPNIGVFEQTSLGSDDVFTLKITASGEFIWVKSHGSSGLDVGATLTIDDENNAYVGGYFTNTVDFDPSDAVYSLSSVGGSDAFIQKLDEDGNFIWAKTFGSAENERTNSITTDGYGNLYVIGKFELIVDFDSGVDVFELTSEGSDDMFIVKLDLAGDFVWAKAVGGTGLDAGIDIEIDALENIYLTGNFQNTVDFDPNIGVENLVSNGSRDVFIQKLDKDGNYIWAGSFGSSNYEIARSVSVFEGVSIYLTGGYQATVDFDVGDDTFELTAEDNTDIFVNKINLCYEMTSVDTIVSCDSYTWIDDVEYTTDTVGAMILLTSELGCDSIVTLHLTIFESASSIDSHLVCDSLIWTDGITYYEDNFTATDTFTNVVGCDSIVTLNLTVNYSWEGVDINIACDSMVWTDGITYYEDNFTAVDSFISIYGCDSIVTLNLAVNYSSEGIDTQTACDSLIWIDGEIYIADNTSATYTLTNANGCDSLVTLNLTVNYSSTGTDVQTACNSYTWLDGVEYFEDNTTATFGLTNEAGCDSIITLDLTIYALPGVVFSALDDNIVCFNSPLVFLSGTPSDGIFSGPGVIDSSFDPEVAGEGEHTLYYSYEDDNGCIAADSVLISVVDCLGLANINQTKITTYPNPFDDFTTINFGKELTKNHIILIYDILGQEVYRNEHVTGVSLEIKKEQLGVGVYMLSLFNSDLDELFNTRLLVQ